MKPQHDFVWLASQSPRRRQLLDQIGAAHQLLLPDADEDAEALEATRSGELPADYVCRVTRAKLDAARLRLLRRGLAAAPVLCADTTVAIGRRILGKPADAAEATAMLAALSGRSHRVLSTVAVGAGRQSRSLTTTLTMPLTMTLTSITRVRFARLPAATIDAYVNSGEPFGKAGAYAIQSSVAAWIERIDGSHSGIMGLPLYETAQLLKKAGVGGF